MSPPPDVTEPVDDYPYPVGRIALEYLPVDPESVLNFHGLGNLNVLPEDHGGFFPPLEGHRQAPTIPVYAVADGKIKGIGKDWYERLAPHGHDLAIVLKVSTTMTVTYAHVNDLAAEIWDAAGEMETGYGIMNRVDIPVIAGQVIAYVGTQAALDFYVTDRELDLFFANPSRYPEDWPFSGCYHDYFPEPLRSQFLSITERQVEPRCGKIDYDEPGRIVGNWFLEDEVPPYAFDDYSTHFAIVYGFIEGDRIAISDGLGIREGWGASRIFWVKGNAPRPETVGAAQGLVKYELMDAPPLNPWGERPPLNETIVGVFLVQLLEPGRLKVERLMDKTAAEVERFSADARIYIR